MTNLSGKDFLATLKCLDIETKSVTGESLDWLFDKKETSDILTWLCTNLTENNVETCNDIQEYTAAENEGQNISKDYIDATCKSNPIFEDIFNVNTSQINSLKREIENAKIKAENLNKLTSKYLFLEGKLNRNIQDEELNLRVKRKSYLSQCMADGLQVDELHNKCYERVENFCDIFSNYDMMREKYFISHMPLHTYKQQSDMFQTDLHLWIRKNFETPIYSHTNEDMNNINKELNRLYYAITESIIKHVQSECNQKEITAKLSYFRNNTYSEMTEEYRRVQEIQYTSRINILFNDLKILYANDLKLAAEKFVENLINTVLIKNAEIKLNKCRNILKVLKDLNGEIIEALARYELLFLLLKTDKVKRQEIDKFLEDLYFYCSNYLKTYTLRSQLMNEIDNNTGEQTFNEMISILNEKYNDDPVNISLTISEVEKQKVAIENLENDIFVIRNKKYLNEVNEVSQNIRKSKNLIWCGPTLQPVIVPYEFLVNLNNTNCQIEKVQNALKRTMDNLKRTRVSMKKDTWVTHRRLLWIWFLMKPEKLPVVIEQLKDFVTEKARSIT